MKSIPRIGEVLLMVALSCQLPLNTPGMKPAEGAESFAALSSRTITLWPGDPPHSAPGNLYRPTLDIYLIESRDPRGAVLICPGGGYHMRAQHEGKDIAERFNKAGYHAFVVQYRVAPNRNPAPLLDASRALRMIRRNAAEWKVKPDHIAVCGFSAGGHLAATLGTRFDAGKPEDPDPIERLSSRPDALILCYAVISFTQYVQKDSAWNLLGKEASPDLMKEFSAELNVTAKTPPAFLWSTADDTVVPVENSILFAQALHKFKIPYEMHIYPTGPHGMGLALQAPHVATWPELCCQWLKGMGW